MYPAPLMLTYIVPFPAKQNIVAPTAAGGQLLTVVPEATCTFKVVLCALPILQPAQSTKINDTTCRILLIRNLLLRLRCYCPSSSDSS